MEINNFNANGQKIFIEHDWITGKTCLFNVTNSSDYLKGLVWLSTIRKEFIKKLEAEGFIVTEDKYDTDKDIISLIMNSTAIECDDNKSLASYKKAFDQRMFEAGGPNLNYPYSVSIEEYFSNPFFPVVFKNESTNAGKDKFLIETPEQVEVLKRFYNKYKTTHGYKHQFDCSIFQQLIETPTENKTYMRVLMSASGDVLGASLKYSRIATEGRVPRGLFEKHFWNPNSEFFLNCRGMFNYYWLNFKVTSRARAGCLF